MSLKSSIFSIMGLTDTQNVNDTDDLFSVQPEDLKLYEIFFAGGEISESDDGLIYKDIMREGEWAYRPGPGQKPTPVPLKVIPGHSSSEEEIGMADLVEAFNDRAIDHVTIPTSHEDKPHENTGYVKKLSIVNDEKTGKAMLRAGLEFTEPEIKGKATRGSIANTSAGIIFDYIKKDSGKKFKMVLGHVALTNKPWLNGMKPFGVNASEEYSDEEFEITPLILSDIVWEKEKSLAWLRENFNKSINENRVESDLFYVSDISSNRALVTKFDNSGGTSDNYVVPFDIQNGNIEIPSEDKWIKASQEWVEASLSEEKGFEEFVKENHLKNFDNDTSLSEEAPNQAAVNDANNPLGGKDMASETKSEQETEAGAPSNDQAQVTDLSEEKIQELRAEFGESLKDQKSENEKLRKELHEMKVDKRITELSKQGFAEHAGLLSTIREIMLADNGSLVLTLSEENGAETHLSASDIADKIVDSMPKDDNGKVKLGEQALLVEEGKVPPSTTKDTDLSEEERSEALAEGLGVEYKAEKDGDE